MSARVTIDAPGLALTAPMVAGVGVVVAGLGWAMSNTTYDTWGGLLVGLGLVLLGVPLVALAARAEPDPRIAKLLFIAFGLKLTAALVRLLIVFGVYDGVADANLYHQIGAAVAPQLRAGDFNTEIGAHTGTGFIELLTGLVYVVTGPTRLGGFFVFSFLGFWGLYFFYRAFCLACPNGDRWRYALLVFLMPSLLFWSSSIGKEAWMMFTLGLTTFGAARVLTHARGGLLLTCVGLTGIAVVRPHISAIFLASLLVAFVLRRPPAGGTLLSPLGKLGVLLVLAVAMLLIVDRAENFFRVDSFNAEAIAQVLQQTELRTSQGGSVFDFYQADSPSPATFPLALVSVLFRPLPIEAHNRQAVVASVEGVMLMAVFLVGWRRLAGAIRSLLRTPYVVLCCCYGLLFVYGFSSFSNFGILTRQRVQVLPFVLVLAALPPFRPAHKGWRGWRNLLAEDDAATQPTPGLSRRGTPIAARSPAAGRR